MPPPSHHHPKLPHLGPLPQPTLPTPPPPNRPSRPPPPHRPSLNPPLQCPPPPPQGAFGPLLLGGGVAYKSEETAPPCRGRSFLLALRTLFFSFFVL